MADRYQDRPFPADDGYDRGDDQHAPARTESDPLAELARLIGQTDPFANIGGRANQPVQPRSASRASHISRRLEADDDAARRSAAVDAARRHGRTAIRRRIIRRTITPHARIYPSAEHPLHRYAAQHARARSRNTITRRHSPRPISRSIPRAMTMRCSASSMPAGTRGQHDPAYSDDAYAYQDGYDDGAEEQRRSAAAA